jgi:hypothetical protein
MPDRVAGGHESSGQIRSAARDSGGLRGASGGLFGSRAFGGGLLVRGGSFRFGTFRGFQKWERVATLLYRSSGNRRWGTREDYCVCFCGFWEEL